MAEDEEFPEGEEEFEEDLADADVDPDELDEEELGADEFGLEEDDDAPLTEEEEVEEEDDEEGPAVRRAAAPVEDEDDDDDLSTPDDVEADLDTILKDRLVTQDDEGNDDEDEVEVDDRGEPVDRIQPKRPGEFVCQSCFLLKPPSQLADARSQFCSDCV